MEERSARQTPPTIKRRKTSTERIVFLLNSNGNPLPPTTSVVANKLLAQGRVLVIRRGTPYVLQFIDYVEGHDDFRFPFCKVEVFVKSDKCIKVTTIFPGRRTIIFPYYLTKLFSRNGETPRNMIESAKWFVQEIATYCRVFNVCIVYDDVTMSTQSTKLFLELRSVPKNPNLVTRRMFKRPEKKRDEKKQVSHTKFFMYKIREMFGGFYTHVADDVVKKEPQWYVKFCREFVRDVLLPYYNYVKKVRKIDRRFLYFTKDDWGLYVIHKFKNFDIYIQAALRYKKLTLPPLTESSFPWYTLS